MAISGALLACAGLGGGWQAGAGAEYPLLTRGLLRRPCLRRAAADPLSQQALEVQAQDLALEDALYALDKALNAGTLEPDVYLKQARRLGCGVAATADVLGGVGGAAVVPPHLAAHVVGVSRPRSAPPQVRSVSRRQFYVRTCGNKVAVLQQEQQRRAPPPPPRLEQQHDMARTLSAGRPVVLPQGDR